MKNKKAFSVIEMLIVLGILAVFIAVAAPIFTKKFKDPSKVPHGQYECYRGNDGKVYEVKVFGSKHSAPVLMTGNTCTFKPPKQKPAYFMVTMVGGGGSGSNTETTSGGGKPGKLLTTFFPTINKEVTMEPGAGGPLPTDVNTDGNPGFPTTFDTTTTEGSTLTVGGGAGGKYEANLVEAPTEPETPEVPAPTYSTGCENGIMFFGLCVDKEDTPTSSISSASSEYQELVDKGYIVGSSGLVNDYWAGSLYSCYKKGLVVPSQDELRLMSIYIDPLNLKLNNSYWTNEMTSWDKALYIAPIESGPYYSTFDKAGTFPHTRCAKINFLPIDKSNCTNGTIINDNLCVDKADTTPMAGLSYSQFYSTIQTNKYYMPITSSIYQALKDKSLITMFYGDSVSNFGNDRWAGAVIACNSKGMRLPTFAEFLKLNENYSNGNSIGLATAPYWIQHEVNNLKSGVASAGLATFDLQYRLNPCLARCVKDYEATAEPEPETETPTGQFGVDTNTRAGKTSGFDDYIKIGSYHYQVKNRGDGASAGFSGYPGAIVIVW